MCLYKIKCVVTGSNILVYNVVTVAITISKTKMVAQVIQLSGVIRGFKKLADPVRL